MSVQNPYLPPQADPNAPVSAGGITAGFLPEGRGVPASNGFGWIGQGFELFKQAPGTWIGIIIVYFLIYFGMGLIPVVGSLATMLLQPVFTAGLVCAAASEAERNSIELGNLFDGFRRNAGQLVLLGVLTLLCTIVACMPMLLVGGMAFFAGLARGNIDELFTAGMAIAVLTTMAGVILMAMAFYWAPALVALQNMSAVNALRSSFLAAVKNILPFLAFGVLAFAVSIAGMLALVIGFFLVVVPTLIASTYTSYRDVFFEPGAGRI